MPAGLRVALALTCFLPQFVAVSLGSLPKFHCRASAPIQMPFCGNPYSLDQRPADEAYLALCGRESPYLSHTRAEQTFQGRNVSLCVRVVPVPEPAPLILLGIGITVLFFILRWKH